MGIWKKAGDFFEEQNASGGKQESSATKHVGGISWKIRGVSMFFSNQITRIQKKKGGPFKYTIVCFFWFPQRLKWSLITYFALSQDTQKTSKLKTQLMFTVKNVKNLVLIKFISLWDISFDFFSNHLNTQLPGTPSDPRFDYKRPWNFEGPTPKNQRTNGNSR